MEMSVFSVSGLGGLIILALDLWAIISVIGSRASTGAKVLWTLLILVLPVLGFVLWLLFGPRARTTTI
jgi:succinate dehydrogenase/fumarate reductase cytochrome b subunit